MEHPGIVTPAGSEITNPKFKNMKIHKPPPPEHVIRLMITKQGHKTEYLTLSECTQDEVIDWLKGIFSFVSPFETGRSINIQAREAVGSTNGKSKSITFKGVDPQKAVEIIMNHIA